MVTSQHCANFLAMLEEAVASAVNEGDTESRAFTRVAAEWLGYDLEEQLTDGANDRGVDFWCETDSGYELFQVKSKELSKEGKISLSAFDKGGVDDLRRMVEFLEEDPPSKHSNEKVAQLHKDWRMSISKRRMSEKPQPLEVDLKLVLFGEGLTGPAEGEYNAFRNTLADRAVDDVPVVFRPQIVTVLVQPESDSWVRN